MVANGLSLPSVPRTARHSIVVAFAVERSQRLPRRRLVGGIAAVADIGALIAGADENRNALKP